MHSTQQIWPRATAYALAIVAAIGCKTWGGGQDSSGSGRSGQSVSTTYYPSNAEEARAMGPGHFSCAHLNGEQQWYLAPSDTFGDPKLWEGPPCPFNPRGGVPDCAAVQKTCGVRVKLVCAINCRPDAPTVVAMITDFCPRHHPLNKFNGACQNGPHFDIGRPIWELMRQRDNNISVYYEVVDANTPLGPVGKVASNNAGQSSGSRKESRGDTSWCDPRSPTVCFPYCTNGSDNGNQFGWQPELGGPDGGSCRVPAPADQLFKPNDQWCDPQQFGVCFPYCTNGSDTGDGFGWQPDLSGPNGGSCRVSQRSEPQPASSRWCDPNQTNQCYPYCTNGSNTGSNFGWQPDLGGPNGGSCRVP